MSTLSFAAAALWALVAAAPVRVAVMPLTAGDGVTPAAATSLTSMVVAEARRARNVSVIAQDEIQQALSLEQQRQLLGCGGNDRCRVEAASALGVDLMIVGTLGKLGESWLLHIKLMEATKVSVIKEVDRRQKGGKVDDMLDALPGMMATLMEAAVQAPAANAPVATGGSAPVAAGNVKPINHADVPLDPKLRPAKMRLATDGKGHYMAYEDGWGSDWPLFSSRNGKTFVASRIPGRGRNGNDFDYTFWEPRVNARWQGSFFSNKEGMFLQCGDNRVPFKPVADKEATAMLKNATWLMPRWKRIPHALVRDDLGVYWLVDGEREAKERKDLRLYRGKKGAMVLLKVDDVLQEKNENVMLTPTGRLKVDYATSKATWVEGGVETVLKWLELESSGRLIYQELGPYQGEPLGTPCDGSF